MTLLEELKARGLVEAVTDPEIEKLLETPQTVYCGFDPSAASLQAGNLVSIMVLRRFQQAGKALLPLLNGGTALFYLSRQPGARFPALINGAPKLLCLRFQVADPLLQLLFRFALPDIHFTKAIAVLV